MKNAYQAGVQQALETFGVRVAADFTQNALPHGDPALGAEWLARQLTEMDDAPHSPDSKPKKKNRLERPSRWGDPTSFESADTYSSYPGVGSYGIV